MTGRVIQGIGGFYTVMTAEGETYQLRAMGKLRRQNLKPTVGDMVSFLPGEGGQDGWLSEIHPRANIIRRPPVANIERLVLVVAAASPDPDLGLVDRMLIAARQSGIPAMLVVNKCELGEAYAREVLHQYRGAGLTDRVMASAQTEEGLGVLRACLKGRVHAFAGQSGVGKSSLINGLYGVDLGVGDVSERLGRGRHTTRQVQLLPLGGGTMVLDTPGFSLMELELIEPIQLEGFYHEFLPYQGQCHFAPCAHLTEPGCGVLAAVERGEIDRLRWQRYQTIFEEMQIRWRERYGKRT